MCVKLYPAPNCREPIVLVQSLLPKTMCVWCFLSWRLTPQLQSNLFDPRHFHRKNDFITCKSFRFRAKLTNMIDGKEQSWDHYFCMAREHLGYTQSRPGLRVVYDMWTSLIHWILIHYNSNIYCKYIYTYHVQVVQIWTLLTCPPKVTNEKVATQKKGARHLESDIWWTAQASLVST